MGDLHQRFYHGADVFVLDASAPVDLRPRQCGLENHFHQYQHFIHVGGGHAAGLFAVAFDCVDAETLSRCFFKADFDSGIIAFRR